MEVVSCTMSRKRSHEEALVAAADGVADVGGAFLHGLGQHVHHLLLELVQRKERAVQQRVALALLPVEQQSAALTSARQWRHSHNARWLLQSRK